LAAAPLRRHRKPSGSSAQNAGLPLTLPPGVSPEKFKEFTLRASETVGEDSVIIITKPEKLQNESYLEPSKVHDMFHVLDKEYFVSSAIITPREYQMYKLSCVFVMSLRYLSGRFLIGRNVAYCGAGPRVPGSIGLDLGRHMNKVLEVDVEGAFALVEPGVTFFEMHDYLEKHNLRDRVWLDVAVGRSSATQSSAA
jgi:hypothetical protein